MPTHTPPIYCTRCRVTYKGVRYQVEKNGQVQEYSVPLSGLIGDVYHPSMQLARDVRREASRQRRNRNARERSQALRDLGMVRTTAGQWE